MFSVFGTAIMVALYRLTVKDVPVSISEADRPAPLPSWKNNPPAQQECSRAQPPATFHRPPTPYSYL